MGTSKKMQRLERNRRRRCKTKKYKPRPKLYWVDRLLYWILILLPIGMIVHMLIAMNAKRNALFENQSLLAVFFQTDDHGFYMILLCILAMVMPLAGLMAGQPIFGIPGLAYGREGGMRPEHVPIFYRSSYHTGIRVRAGYAIGAGVMVLCLVLSLFLIPGALNRRWEIYDTHLQYIGDSDTVEETLSWNQITGYKLSTDRTGGKSVSYYVSVELETRDGEQLEPRLSSFRDLEAFLRMDEKLTQRGVRRQIHFDEQNWRAMVRRESYPEETMQVLAQLFGVE